MSPTAIWEVFISEEAWKATSPCSWLLKMPKPRTPPRLSRPQRLFRAAPMDHDGRVLHRLRRLSGLHDLRTLGLRLLGLTALQGLQLLQRLLPPSPSRRAQHQGSCILGSMLWLGGSGGSGFGSGGGGVSGFTYTLQQRNPAPVAMSGPHPSQKSMQNGPNKSPRHAQGLLLRLLRLLRLLLLLVTRGRLLLRGLLLGIETHPADHLPRLGLLGTPTRP